MTNSTPAASATKTVLILEDDPALRRLLAPALCLRGFRVLEAGDAASADEQLDRDSVDVVIVDGVLPDELGIRFIERLRRSARSVHVAFISGHFRDLATISRLTNDLDVALVFYKPVDPVQVAARVAETCAPAAFDAASAGVASCDAPAPMDMADLDDLRREYAERLPYKLSEIEQAIARYRSGASPLAEARSLAHRLRGSAGSYGHAEVGEAVGLVELLLEEALPSGAERRFLWERVATAMHDAKVAVDLSCHHPMQRGTVTVGDGRQLLLLSTDAEFAKVVTGASRKSLASVVSVGDPAAALERAQQEHFAVVVIDAGFSESDSIALLRGIRATRSHHSVPIAFATSERSIETRVAAVQAGATRFFEKPVTEVEFSEILRQLSSAAQAPEGRVLIVDDDDDVVRSYSQYLGAANFVVERLASANGLVSRLEEARIDVLLLDVGLPKISGIDVCRALRMSGQWELLPIVIVTAQTDANTRLRAYRAGASDVITKPILAEELLARVRVQEERVRLLRDRADKDALSGLLLRRALVDALQRLLGLCSRDGKPLSLVLFDIDHFKRVNDTHGHLAGDRVIAAFGELLRQRFRVEDLRARWGGEEFLLVLPGSKKGFATEAAARLLRDFSALEFSGDDQRKFSATFTAGVAEYPENGRSLATLIRYADELLYAGKRAGRNRVVSSLEQIGKL